MKVKLDYVVNGAPVSEMADVTFPGLLETRKRLLPFTDLNTNVIFALPASPHHSPVFRAPSRPCRPRCALDALYFILFVFRVSVACPFVNAQGVCASCFFISDASGRVRPTRVCRYRKQLNAYVAHGYALYL